MTPKPSNIISFTCTKRCSLPSQAGKTHFWLLSGSIPLHQPQPGATQECQVTRAEAVPGRVQTVMRQPPSPCPPLGSFTDVDVTIHAQTHYFVFKHSKLSGFRGAREFRVKTMYFPRLFPCRLLAALTHDELLMKN